MIILVVDNQRSADLFLDRKGVEVLMKILENYQTNDEDDHDHIHFSSGLVSENIVDGFNFENQIMADELTLRFRKSLKLK